MPDDPNAQAPQPAAPAQPDYAAELAAERAARAQAEQQAAAIRQQAEAEKQQLYQWAQSLQASVQQAQSQPAVAPVQEDPNVVVTRGDVDAMMKQAQQNWMNQVGQVMGQQELQRLNATRATNRRLAASDQSMPYFSRFASEIDTILNSVDPRVAAQEHSYRQTYEIVRARHFDELMNEERQRWRSQPTDDGEYEPEPPSQASATPAQVPVNPRTPVMPTPQGGTPARGANRRVRRDPLDAHERDAIQRHFGGDVNAYEEALKAEVDEDPYDMFGFEGKKRV